MTKKVTGYSRGQVALHWSVAVLVAFQYVAHDGIVTSWRAYEDGKPPPSDMEILTYMHIVSGALVLLLALARLYLRFTRGAPSPPADEPWLLKMSGEAVHALIYVLIVLLPISGMVAWFAGIELAATVHVWLQNILLAAIALHIAGGLFQHFIRRSDVLMRMFKPQRR
jgi:cytochrome b561